MTIDELKVKFHALWLRGSGWRLETGEVLYQLKSHMEYGAWGDFLAEYDLPRSTADGYVREYKNKVGITEPRQFDDPNPEALPDIEVEERAADIDNEKARRVGKRATHNPTQIRPIIKNLRTDHVTKYWQDFAADSARANAIWLQALYIIIRADVLFPPAHPDGAFIVDPEPEEEEMEVM